MRSLTLRDQYNTHLVLALVHNFLQQLEEPGKSDARSRLGIDRDSGDRLSRDTLQTTQREKITTRQTLQAACPTLPVHTSDPKVDKMFITFQTKLSACTVARHSS